MNHHIKKITAVLSFVLICSITSVFAQRTAIITGFVKDSSNSPVADVFIGLEGSRISTESGTDGQYKLTVPTGGEMTVVFFHASYAKKKIDIPPLQPGETFVLNMLLTSRYVEKGPISVTARKRDMQIMNKVKPKIFEAMPNASGGIEGIIKMLPGVSSSNELSSQYSVRGGNYDENLVYINDIEIFKPQLIRSSQQEGLSVINSDLVESLSFSAGGFEARYGDKLSSVLDITYKEPDTFSSKVSLSLLGAGATLEGSTDNHRFSYLLGARYRTNQYLLNSLDVQGEYKPAFADVQSFLNYYASDKLQFGLLSYYGSNRYLSIPQSQETTFGTANTVLRLNVGFAGQEILEYQTLLNGLTASYKFNENHRIKFINSLYMSNEEERFDIIAGYQLSQVESDLGSDSFGKPKLLLGAGEFFNHGRNRLNTLIYNSEIKGSHSTSKAINLNWGLKFQHEELQDKLSEYRYIDSADYSLPQNGDNVLDVFEYISSRNKQAWNRYMGYLQNTWTFSEDYNALLTFGARGNYWDYNKELLISPRMQFSFEPNLRYNRSLILEGLNDSILKTRLKNTWRLKATSGFYHQPPFFRELRNLNGTLNPEIRAQKSYHFVVGSDLNFEMWDRTFRWTTEVYYKHLTDIIPYEFDNVRIRYYAQNNAKGYATGIDMQLHGEFVKDNPSWISLSYMKTEEDIINDSFIKVDRTTGEKTLVHPGYIPRPTDQRFRFALFFQDFLPKHPSYKAHINLVFASGLPYGPPDFTRYKDTMRMPPYRRVDIGFSRLVYDKNRNPVKGGFLKNFRSIWISAEMFNLFDINNTISYLWVSDVSGNKFGIPNYLTSRRLNIHIDIKF